MECVADAEGGDGRERGEEDGQPLGVEAALEGEHRAAEHTAVFRLDAVFDGQQPFRIFGGHTEDAGDPAPEHRAGAAEGHGRGHAHDVAGADGGRQGGGQGAELADVAVRLAVLGQGQPDGFADFQLRKTQADGHEYVGAQEQNDHRPAPYGRGDLFDEGCD